MFDKTRFDDAVSPVVGVILMVAVTVILAAVIGSFVLDLGSNVQQNPQAGVTFDQAPNASTNGPGYNVDVNIISMENADDLTIQDDGAHSSLSEFSSDPPTVGESATVSDLQDGDTVSVIGHLNGKEAVIQTHTVE